MPTKVGQLSHFQKIQASAIHSSLLFALLPRSLYYQRIGKRQRGYDLYLGYLQSYLSFRTEIMSPKLYQKDKENAHSDANSISSRDAQRAVILDSV